MEKFIITIGREFGSGGLDVGRMLSDKLNVKCYDKELLSMAAKESGLCQEIFENHDEKPTNSFLYSLVMDTYSVSGYTSAPFLDMPLNHIIVEEVMINYLFAPLYIWDWLVCTPLENM